MATKYTKSIQSDFPNHAVSTDRLTQEIRESAIVTALDYINTDGDDCDIWFKADLSSGDVIILAGVVAAHSGTPLPSNAPVLITTASVGPDGCPIFQMDAPQETDKRPVMVNSPGREGSYTWITSRGDDLTPTPHSSGRGEGTMSLLSFTGPDTAEVEIPFMEAMQLLGGSVYWRPIGSWDFEDTWNLLIRLPATVAVPNGTNTGNCNLVPTGLGFNIIVPAAGDGAYDVDLETVVPVPDGYSTSTQTGSGYWNVDRFWSETITPNGEAHGEFNLYDLALEFYFCKNVSCGNPEGTWKLDSYKAEWISSRWVTIFKATRVTTGAGKIGGFFHVYRPGAT